MPIDTKKAARDLLESIVMRGDHNAISKACELVFGKPTTGCLLELFDLRAGNPLVSQALTGAASAEYARVGEVEQLSVKYHVLIACGTRVVVTRKGQESARGVIYAYRMVDGKHPFQYQIQYDGQLSPDSNWVDGFWVAEAGYEQSVPVPGYTDLYRVEAPKHFPFDKLGIDDLAAGWKYNAGRMPAPTGQMIEVLFVNQETSRGRAEHFNWVWELNYTHAIRAWRLFHEEKFPGTQEVAAEHVERIDPPMPRMPPPFLLAPLTPEEIAAGWQLNDLGIRPVLPNVDVQVTFNNGVIPSINSADVWIWDNDGSQHNGTIRLWRLAPTVDGEPEQAAPTKPLTKRELAEGWAFNIGVQPDAPYVQVMFADGSVLGPGRPDFWSWTAEYELGGVIRAWRQVNAPVSNDPPDQGPVEYPCDESPR